MKSKKLTALLLAVGVVASTCALFNEKPAFADNIKQNVVYTKEDTSTVSKNNTDLSEADNEAIKAKSSEALIKYFNISAETIKKSSYSMGILNNKTILEIQPKEEKMIQEAYENKQMSAEEYNKRKAQISENYKGLKDTIAKLKHGFIQTSWSTDKKFYMVFFNENTKEADWVIGGNDKPSASEVSLKLSEEQYKNIAETFIKQHKLGDLQNEKCILVKGNHLYYQDGNDSSKKVHVAINPYTGKVSSFAIKAYANMFYEEIINEK